MPMRKCSAPDGRVVVMMVQQGKTEVDTPNGKFKVLKEGDPAANVVTPAIEASPAVLETVSVLQKAAASVPQTGEKVSPQPPVKK